MLIDPIEYARKLSADGLDTFDFLDALDIMRKNNPHDPVLIALDADDYRNAVLSELGRLDDEAVEWAIVMHEAHANI